MKVLNTAILSTSLATAASATPAQTAASVIRTYTGVGDAIQGFDHAVKSEAGRQAIAAAARTNPLVAFDGESTLVLIDQSGTRERLHILQPAADTRTLTNGFNEPARAHEDLRFECGALTFTAVDTRGARSRLQLSTDGDHQFITLGAGQCS